MGAAKGQSRHEKHAAAGFEDAPGDGATKDAGDGGRGGHGKERDGADAADGARVEAERALLEEVDHQVVLLLLDVAGLHRRRVHLQRRGSEAGLVEQLPDRTRRPAVARAVVEDALEVALHDPVEGTCTSRTALAETDTGKGKAVVAVVPADAEVMDWRVLDRRHRDLRRE